MNNTISQEKFKGILSDKSNGQITLLNDFSGINSLIKLVHTCGHEWECHAYSILYSYSGCPKCRLQLRNKKRHENLLNKVKEIHEDSISVLGIYEGASKPIEFLCNECGHRWFTRPSHVMSDKSGCPKCARKRIKHSDFIRKLKKVHKGNVISIENYELARKKILFKCLICSYEWKAQPDSVVNGGCGCPKCAGNLQPTHEEFLSKFRQIHNDKIEVMGKYKSFHKKIKFKHRECGYEWESSPMSILYAKYGCPRCGGSQKRTHEEFVEVIHKKFNGSIEVLGRYINNRTKVKLKHNCGHEWDAIPTNILKPDRGCPACSESTGEKLIKKILRKKSIKYKSQYKFPDCVYIRRLMFDIAILKEEKLVLLIEYDGGQHFFSVEGWGGDEVFERVKERDRIKNDYCRDNNIPLLRIPYWLSEEEITDKVNEAISNYVLEAVH